MVYENCPMFGGYYSGFGAYYGIVNMVFMAALTVAAIFLIVWLAQNKVRK